MGVSELRDAFNAVAEPSYTAQRAYLSYEIAHDVQWQRIAFAGVDRNGNPFTCKSDLLRPESHLAAAATAVASNLLANPKANP